MVLSPSKESQMRTPQSPVFSVQLQSLSNISFSLYQRTRSHSHLGKAKEILNLPLLCITRIMAKEATRPKTKHAERMILPSSSQKYTWTYLWVRGVEKHRRKVWFRRHLSHTKLLTSIAYQLKQLLRCLTHRTALGSTPKGSLTNHKLNEVEWYNRDLSYRIKITL